MIRGGTADVLSVWWFDGATGAERAVHRLAAAARRLTIHDACIVSWVPGQRRPVAWQEAALGGTNRLAGAFWGLLVSWLFLLPISRSPAARGTGYDEPTGPVHTGDDLGEDCSSSDSTPPLRRASGRRSYLGPR